jgi:hypothetical protein
MLCNGETVQWVSAQYVMGDSVCEDSADFSANAEAVVSSPWELPTLLVSGVV